MNNMTSKNSLKPLFLEESNCSLREISHIKSRLYPLSPSFATKFKITYLEVLSAGVLCS
jgi:hypothetical protein